MELAHTSKEALETTLQQIKAEIRSYPAPITACDVHFNRLLEDRARLTQELKRLGG